MPPARRFPGRKIETHRRNFAHRDSRVYRRGVHVRPGCASAFPAHFSYPDAFRHTASESHSYAHTDADAQTAAVALRSANTGGDSHADCETVSITLRRDLSGAATGCDPGAKRKTWPLYSARKAGSRGRAKTATDPTHSGRKNRRTTRLATHDRSVAQQLVHQLQTPFAGKQMAGRD